MVDAIARDLLAMFRPLSLGEHERALDYGLRVKRQAFGGERARHAMVPHRGLDVRLQRLRVAGDAVLASQPDRRVRAISLLHHCADEAGELRQLAADDLLSEIDIAEQPVQRIAMAVIGRMPEELARRLRPM